MTQIEEFMFKLIIYNKCTTRSANSEFYTFKFTGTNVSINVHENRRKNNI